MYTAGSWCEQVMNTGPSGAMGAPRQRVFNRRAATRRIICCEGKRRSAACGGKSKAAFEAAARLAAHIGPGIVCRNGG